jgi:hypothetical protein
MLSLPATLSSVSVFTATTIVGDCEYLKASSLALGLFSTLTPPSRLSCSLIETCSPAAARGDGGAVLSFRIVFLVGVLGACEPWVDNLILSEVLMTTVLLEVGKIS